jgi:hypothetical protein
MRLSCSHPVLLYLPAEPKASAMIRNALYDILINFMIHRYHAPPFRQGNFPIRNGNREK